ncbi:MAG: zinc ribbon domain-containing protein [Bellilinea sp.]
MDQRTYHGKITPDDLARSLIAHFNRGNLRVQQIGSGAQIAVQIASRQGAVSGGQTALGISLQQIEDGVMVQTGRQAWYGIAASLGMTAIAAIRNPFSLINRVDDLAQDIEYIQLTDEVWRVVDLTARSLKAGHELSERLRRLVCSYCDTPNPVGEPNCIACGAPLGSVQPIACPKCGNVVTAQVSRCPNCGTLLVQ